MKNKTLNITIPRVDKNYTIKHQLNFPEFLKTEKMLSDISDKEFDKVISVLLLRFKQPCGKQAASLNHKQEIVLRCILLYISRNITRNRIRRVHILRTLSVHKRR